MLRIGIIGLGVISHYYLAALRENHNFKLHAVCDLDTTKFSQINDSNIYATTDYRELLADPSLDAVIINLPNSLHYSVCREALLANKHVCCEKPLTLQQNEALSLSFLAKKMRRTLFTAFHRRYNTNYLNLLNQLPERKFLKKVVIEYKEKIQEHMGKDVWYLDPKRSGGGCIADNGPNVFDTLTDLLGELKVCAVICNNYVNNVEMAAEIHLQTLDNISVVALLDWNYQHGESKKIALHLTDGTVIHADMLENYAQFKSSLYHEYVGVLFDFTQHIDHCQGSGEEGVRAVNLVNECYLTLKRTTLEEAV